MKKLFSNNIFSKVNSNLKIFFSKKTSWILMPLLVGVAIFSVFHFGNIGENVLAEEGEQIFLSDGENSEIPNLSTGVHTIVFTKDSSGGGNLRDYITIQKRCSNSSLYEKIEPEHWDNIIVEDNDTAVFKLSAMDGFTFNQDGIELSFKSKINPPNTTLTIDDDVTATLELTNCNSDITYVLQNIQFKKYELGFVDNYGNNIVNNKADFIFDNPQVSTTEIVYNTNLRFDVRLKPEYNRSNIIVSAVVNDTTIKLNRDKNNYYEFLWSEFPSAGDVTIEVVGIELNKYDVRFSINDYDSSKMNLNFSTTHEHSKVDKTFNPNEQLVSDFITHGDSFEFTLELAPDYIFPCFDTGNDTEKPEYDKIYTESLYLKGLITSPISGYKFKFTPGTNETQKLIVTFENVSNDFTQNEFKGSNIGISGSNIVYKNVNVQFKLPNIQIGSAGFGQNLKFSELKKNDNGYEQLEPLVNFDEFITRNIAQDYYFMLAADKNTWLFKNFGLDGEIRLGGSPDGYIGVFFDLEDKEDLLSSSGILNVEPSFFDNYNVKICRVRVYGGGCGSSEKKIELTAAFEGLIPAKRTVILKTTNATAYDFQNMQFSEELKTNAVVTYNSIISFNLKPNQNYVFDSLEKQIKIFRKNADNNYNYNNATNEEILNPDNYTISSYGDNVLVEIRWVQEDIVIIVNADLDKIPIDFKAFEGADYYSIDVNKDENDKYHVGFGDVIHGVVTTPYETDFYFAVKAKVGYDLETLKLDESLSGKTEFEDLLENGANIEFSKNPPNDDIYRYFRVGPIRTNITVSGSISKLKFEVKFNPKSSAYKNESSAGTNETEVNLTYSQEGVGIFKNKLDIIYGGSISFEVTLPEEVNYSKFKIYAYDTDKSGKINDSKREIHLYKGSYTLTDIVSSKVIEAEDISVNKYNVNFLSNDKVLYSVGDNFSAWKSSAMFTAYHGGDCSFRIKPKSGYNLDDSSIVNCKNYKGAHSLEKIKEYDEDGNVVYRCKITGIKEENTVEVKNIQNIVYKIILEKTDGVSYYNDTGAVISDSVSIKYGNNFEFGVQIDDDYDDSAQGMFVVVNNGQSAKLSAQKLASGRYIISNITQDITIKIGNIRKNTYTVTLTKIEGIDYYDANNKIITGNNEVQQGDSISFKVSLYPAYSDSSITVMLGNNVVNKDASGFYNIARINENKTVTIIGVEQTVEADLINIINNLSRTVENIDDINRVIEASKIYNSLSDVKKQGVSNIDVLKGLQEQVKAFHHKSNDVRVEGVDWHIKLMAIPISSKMESCSRIYKKLGSEYILSLYDVYLWDTLNDVRYMLPPGKTAVITLPAPDMSYFERPTGIHEKTDGKLEYLTLNFRDNFTVFETDSFSPMGIIANRTLTPGRSSLLDAVDANVDLIKEYALTNFSSNSSRSGLSDDNSIFNDIGSDSKDVSDSQDMIKSSNINEKYKSRNNRVTNQGSALRLILVLLVLTLISLALWIIFKNRKQQKENVQE